MSTENESGAENNGLIRLGPPFVVDSVGLARRGGPPTMEDCRIALGRICKVKDAVRYWRGDLLNLAGTLFAEDSSQLLDPELLDEKESAEEMRVADKVDPVARAHSPSWQHSQAVAKLAKEDQITWLDKARAEDWSARKLASEMAAAAGGGKTAMRFWLVVECGTEAKRNKLADRLEAEGHSVKRQEALRKVKKAKRKKKGPITAQKKRRGPTPLNQRKRSGDA